MPLDPRAKRLLDMLALSSSKSETTADRRLGFAKLMAMADKPGPQMAVETITAENLQLRLYRPGADAKAALLFFHGGGLVAGSLDTHDGMCRRLAAAAGVNVIAVEYRLAPEARFPAQLEDALQAATWLHQNAAALGLDNHRLAIGGESAGALLAILASSSASLKAIPFKAQILLCPVVDLAYNAGSRAEFAQGYLIDATTIAHDIADCLGPDATLSQMPTPLRMTDFAQLPPTIIHAAEFDPFRDEARALAEHLRKLGARTSFTSHDGMIHSFFGLTGFIPQGEKALVQIGRELAHALL